MNPFLLLKKKSVRILVLAAFLLSLGGLFAGIYFYTKGPEDLSRAKAEFVLDAADFLAEFENDESGAASKYLNKVVEISGLISNMEFNSVNNTLNLTLSSEGSIMGIICTFHGIAQQSDLSVQLNQNHTIRGECSGVLLDVLLNNCILVK